MKKLSILLMFFIPHLCFSQYDAEIISEMSSIDGIFKVEQSRKTLVTFVNTGSYPWGSEVNLHIKFGDFKSEREWLNPGNIVYPGKKKSFVFSIKAPKISGVHRLKLQLHNGYIPFGDELDMKILVIKTRIELKLIRRIHPKPEDEFVRWGGFDIVGKRIYQGVMKKHAMTPGIACYENGKLLWVNYVARDDIHPMLVSADNQVAAMSFGMNDRDSHGGGGVVVMDSKTGDILSRYQTPILSALDFDYESGVNRYHRSIVVGDIIPEYWGTEIISGGNSGEIVCLSQNGKLIWKERVGKLVNLQMAALGKNKIFFAGGWGRFGSFRALSFRGKPLFSLKLGEDCMGVGSSDQGLIAVSIANRPHDFSAMNKIAVLKDDEVVWSKRLADESKTMFWSSDINQDYAVYGFGNHNVESDSHIINRLRGWEGGIILTTLDGNIVGMKKLPDSVKDIKIKDKKVYASCRGGLFIFGIEKKR